MKPGESVIQKLENLRKNLDVIQAMCRENVDRNVFKLDGAFLIDKITLDKYTFIGIY